MSMFSQSLDMGEDTFLELERNQDKHPPAPLEPTNNRQQPVVVESMEIIEESPTGNTTNNRTRSRKFQVSASRQHHGKRTRSDLTLDREKAPRTETTTTTTASAVPKSSSVDDNYSAFFRSDLSEFKENVQPSQQQHHGSLDRYFGESIVFDEPKSPQANTEGAAVADVSDKTRLDMPISSADMDGLSFGECSFSATVATVVEPNNNPDDEEMWSDSDAFANTFSGEMAANNVPTRAATEGASEEVARGIDNVTFTQDFLQPQSSDAPQSVLSILNKTNANSSERSVNQFIRHEMDKCKKSVSRGLANDVSLNESIVANNNSLNNSDTSNIVLNYSAESVPIIVARKTELEIGTTTAAPAAIKSKSLPAQRLNQIDQWGLSKGVVDQYHRKGIITMFDWQVECLSNTKVLFDNANLVYSAPTSAGKTLVSELLMIKTVLEQHRKALFILPFISVVREKMHYLQDLLSPSGLSVEGFFGGYTPPCAFDAIHIAVCTIEKANSIVNKLLEQQRIEQLGCIVVDEIHLISDPSRGYILELLLAKILYACRHHGHRIQIVTMSATLPNLDLLTRWLTAEFYHTDYRPVALQEMIKIENRIYDRNMQLVRRLEAAPIGVQDQDSIGQLCVETLLQSCAVIVFCPSKDWCESLSTHVAGYVYALGKSGTADGGRVRQMLDMAAIAELKAQLRNCAAGLDAVLAKTISYGCAFHHAGLTTDERDIVEGAFKAGVLKVLVATSTLSSGVNLPARRVIVRTPMFGGTMMNALTYRQMIGRAGRTGQDTMGESILVCGAANTVTAGKELLGAQLPALRSCLDADGHVHLKRAILEIIASGMASTAADLERFANCTLLAAQMDVPFSTRSAEPLGDRMLLTRNSTNDNTATADPIGECLKFLLKYEFVRLQTGDDVATTTPQFVATRLGMACLASSMPPGDGFLLFSELQKSRQNFVLESELHAVYIVTPFSVCYQMQSIDWLSFLDMWERLPAAMRRVGEMVGVREAFLVKAMRGQQLDFKALQVHKRFYTALALQELVNETPVTRVALKYKCSRGMLQSLQQMASTFAGVVTAFCTALNWNLLALIVGQFKERLFFGVHRDLIDLMRLSHLNSQRARCLFDGGCKTLAELATADVRRMERVLYDGLGFDARQQRDGESDYEAARRNRARCLYITGKVGLTVGEAARMLIEDARRYLEQEMGLQNVQWSNGAESSGDDGAPKANTDDQADAVASNPVESEDIFQSKSPPIEASSVKRKSPEPQGQASAQLRPPTGASRRSGTRKSPRIAQQSLEIANAVDKKCTIPATESDGEIVGTPVQTQRHNNRSRMQSVLKQTASKSARSKQPIVNPVPTQGMDANSVDSIQMSAISPKYSDLQTIQHFDQLDIQDVCDSIEQFERFGAILAEAGEITLALAVSHNLPRARRSSTTHVIGGNLLRAETTVVVAGSLNDSIQRAQRRCIFDESMLYVNGLMFSIADGCALFYVHMQDDDCVPFAAKVTLLEALCQRRDVTLRMFDAKEQCKTLRRAVPSISEVAGHLEDPRIANWLLQPDVELVGMRKMVEAFAPECRGVCALVGDSNGSGPLGLRYMSEVPVRQRAAVDCLVTGPILRGQKEHMKAHRHEQIMKTFQEMEMPIQQSLIAMEVFGIAVDSTRLTQLAERMTDLMSRLEADMFKLHGRRFNIASTGEVAKVLGMRRNGGAKTGRISTAKAVLQKITDDPMAGLVMQWRKLNAALNQSLRPLQQNVYRERIHGSSWSFTQTGRISMQDPNVQNVAKDFVVRIGTDEELISCRSCFRCAPKRCLLAADFCQLELRILTHLSHDPLMLQVMQSPGDIFTTITATWNGCREAAVTGVQRERTKQICYGIIYGMGVRAIADGLQCDEDTAREITGSFHAAYPGIRAFTERIVGYAQQQGYVETLAGRRRYLPAIVAAATTTPAQRAQAERQAVNTVIQGSAADVVKYAMLRMERNVRKYAAALRINSEAEPGSRVELVMHMHDELVFEVPADRVRSVAKVLRSSMENCAKLRVPLSVKLRAGASWGEMSPVLDV